MQKHTWTIAEAKAKAKLSEILRLASKEGPQRIGTRTPYILIPEDVWKKQNCQRKPFGQYLIDKLSQERGEKLELPDRKEPSHRTIPFSGKDV